VSWLKANRSSLVDRLRQTSGWLTFVGAVVLALGLAWDGALHLADPDLLAYEGLSFFDVPAHLVLVVGSVVTFLGVVCSML
jgi:hypothetical protein